jgi:hypothetical protein
MKICPKILLSFSLTVLLQTLSHASDFEEKVKSLGLILSKPEGYLEVAPKENRDMKYDYALHHPTKKYEIRYTLAPFPEGAVKEYKEWSEKKDKGDSIHTDPNLRFKMMFQAIALNIAGKGSVLGGQKFSPESVKEHFGGDTGSMAVIDMNSDFGAGFSACTVVGIHKENLGEFYIFHLCDDPSTVQSEMDATNFSLRFAPEEKTAPKN